MSDMADVLVLHGDYLWRSATAWECVCGHQIPSGPVTGVRESFAAHQAAALSAAGFGPVQEAKREAWDEGYTTGNAHNGRRDANPYRQDM